MDPSTKTAPCLQVLLQTSFVHFIDAPSLALIMPVLQRALNERSTETKKMASQIIGNMYALTDAKVGYRIFFYSVLPVLSSISPVTSFIGLWTVCMLFWSSFWYWLNRPFYLYGRHLEFWRNYGMAELKKLIYMAKVWEYTSLCVISCHPSPLASHRIQGGVCDCSRRMFHRTFRFP